MKKWGLIALAVLAAAAGFYFFGPPRSQREAAARAEYQTAPVERGSLTATVGATGVVRANQSAYMTWQTSGTVSEVHVSVGDAVTAGQVLATLEQTSLPQAVILAQADLVAAQKALDNLLNSQLQQAQALQAVEEAQRALDDARNFELTQASALEALVNAQKAVEQAERTARNARAPASQSYIDEAKAQVVIAKEQLDRAKEDFAPYENKPEDNVVRAQLLSKMAAAQQQYDAAVRNLNSLQGTASETDQAIADANVEKALAQLAEAEREWERVKDGPSQAEIALLEAQLQDAQREWERVKDGPDPDDVAAAEARVAAAQAAINQASLTAPFDGVVTQVNTMVGDQVSPGTQGFRLDDLSRLLVDIQVSEVDINRIRAGQEVSLIFDAIPNREYHAVVREVAPVGTSEEGIVDFTVTAELVDAAETGGAGSAVKPGMTAAVNIVVEQLEDVLLVPNRAVRVQDGKRVVYVLRGGTAEAVEITLGASSDEMSEIIDGELREGQEVILNPPTTFSRNGPPPFVD